MNIPGAADYAAPKKVGDRVQAHPSTDSWMKGDRYGEVVKVRAEGQRVTVLMDRSRKRRAFRPTDLKVVAP